ncbi:MAG: type II secretion system F family protein [Candidatus Omnitrophica bacterium]|nr:type II secretion system F family protein [Candidatus Omnitrophota bacterium]
MPNYKYVARDKFGKSVSGIIESQDERSAAGELSKTGYVIVSLDLSKATPSEKVAKVSKGGGLFQNVSRRDIALFSRQLYALNNSGVSILAALDSIAKQSENKYFRTVLHDMIAEISAGSSLSGAMSKYPRIFNELYVNVVKAGEVSGSLGVMLNRLAEFGEKDMKNRGKIQSATLYPMITLIALFIALGVISVVVIPKFSKIYSQAKVALPLATRILIGTSGFLRENILFVIGVIFIAVIIFSRIIRTGYGRLMWDSFKLKIPVFGRLNLMFTMESFARTLSIMLSSGLPILQSLEVVSKAANNAKLSQAINYIAQNLKEGMKMSKLMETTGIFPPVIVQMVATGEESGNLDTLLLKVAEYYDQEGNYLLDNLVTLIEPFIVIMLGAMVLVLALGLFLPMWNMFSLFGR